jgi:hypothetical protein
MFTQISPKKNFITKIRRPNTTRASSSSGCDRDALADLVNSATMKPLIMRLFLVCCHFLPLGPKTPSSAPYSWTPSASYVLYLMWQTGFHTHIKRFAKLYLCRSSLCTSTHHSTSQHANSVWLYSPSLLPLLLLTRKQMVLERMHCNKTKEHSHYVRAQTTDTTEISLKSHVSSLSVAMFMTRTGSVRVDCCAWTLSSCHT